jgi:tetratricopeptide (TPR) repeat protein
LIRLASLRPFTPPLIMSCVKRFLIGAILGCVVLVALAVLLVFVTSSASPGDGAAAYEHSHHGIALMQQHLYHAAIDEFEAAIRQSPRALDAWVGLSAIYIRLGNAPKALEGAAKAVTLAKDSADVQLLLGRANWLARNLSDAEGAALRVDELDPSNKQAAELLLRIYFDRKDDAKFRELMDRTENPNRPIQDLALQFAIRQGEFRRAYELRNSFDRTALYSATLRAQLALKREPGRLELYPQLIRDLVRLGRADDAIAARREYRGSSPLDMEMGKAYWLTGNRGEAIRAYTLATSGAHKLSAEVALATITGDRRHWVEAFRAEWIERDYFVLSQLEEVLKTASPLDQAFIYRYAGLFDQDLWNKAAQSAQTVLASQPDDFDALMTLGTAYSRLGRVDDAIRYVQQGADGHPERAEVWSRLGQMALAKGDTATAEQALRRAARSEPSNASYLYNYGWFLDQEDRRAEAATFYERAIASSSLSFEAMNNLALIEAARGRPVRALDLLNKAVTSNPENEGTYLNRGNYYASVHRWKEAIADYAEALMLNPANVVAAVESARIHLELKRADIAIEELDAALDVDPRVHEAYILLAAAYEKQGRKTEAAAARNEAKQLKDSD